MNICRYPGAMLLICTLALPASAQQAKPPPVSSAAASGASSQANAGKSFSKEELNQLLAPIALYPDPLLAQVLMGSTYPLEVVTAERWIKANPGLKDKALEDALQKQTWDPSVKSLAVFPDVLTMMSEKIDWTQKLGDAFLAQQQDVMATVQELRKKAVAEGTLKDTKEQKIVSEANGATSGTGETVSVIKIEPANPQVVYVPTYNPTTVYGAWPYPSYPPYAYYPPSYYAPGYVAGGMFLSFTAGAIVGSALWGNCNWGRGDVSVNVNKYNNFNRANISNANWRHNSTHRGAVPYRDQRVAQQYGRRPPADAAAREQYRGRADAGRSSIQRGEVAGNFGGRNTAGQSTAGAASKLAERPSGAGVTGGGVDTRGTGNASAFDTSRPTTATRDSSSRGSNSLASSRSSGSFASGGGVGGSRGSFGGGGFGGGRGGGRR